MSRDRGLIDAIEAAPRVHFEGGVFRITRSGIHPLRGFSARGRWDDGTFDVLYTSEEKHGACAECYFHYKEGQPIFPSKLSLSLYEISTTLHAGLELLDMAALAQLGVSPERYGSMEYARRTEEYNRTQQIAEVAHFLECDGLIVASARWKCRNIIIFPDRIAPETLAVKRHHGTVDLRKWAEKTMQKENR